MWTLGDSKQKVCTQVTRKGFLQVGAAGAMGLGLPELLQAQEASGSRKNRKAVILLWLWGGPSHIDTFDMKPDAPLEYRGPWRPISTPVPGIQVCEYLPQLAKLAPDYAVVRTLHHETNDHGLAGTIGLTGRQGAAGRVLPTMGSVVSRLRPYTPPFGSFVTVGQRLHQGRRPIQGEGGGVLGSSYDPFRVDFDEADGVQIQDITPPEHLTSLRIDRRHAFLKTIERAQKDLLSHSAAAPLSKFYDQAFDLVANKAARAVFDLDREKPAVRDRYGRFRFGQCCLMARRLVEVGVPFVQVNWSSHVEAEEDWGDGGWDMHYRHFEITQDRHMWMLDQSMSALLEDLKQRGLLNDTLVVAMGEFGRAPKINEKGGRDHWNPCYSAVFAGGGVRGGQVIGASDARAEYPVERPIKPADAYLSILRTLGIERTDLLALEAAPDGAVIDELF